MIKSVMVLIIAINIVYSSRFSKVTKKFNGKKEFNGVYDAARYEEPIPMEYMEASNDETAQEIKDKLSLVEVDTDGNEYTYEVDVDEVDELLTKAKKLGNEFSNGNSANKAKYHKEEKHDEKEQDEASEAKRRLVILGADTRTEITSTSSSPYTQIGLLEFTSGSSTYICSAALISSKVILTAGHCVHSGGSGGGWYSGFKFYPGRSRFTTSVTGYYYTASRVSTFSGWTSSSNYDYDIGFIELSALPNVGWLSFGWDSSITTSYYLNLAGYPADKSYGSLWYTGDYVTVAYTETLLTDDSDTYGGHSGSSCWFYPAWNSYNLVTLAIHSGSGTYSGVVHNRHTRLTSGKFSSICTWMADSTIC